MRLSFILFIFLCAFCAPLSAQAETRVHEITIGAETRGYRVHVPPAWTGSDGRALPVVLALHGGGGSGLQMEEHYGLNALADRAEMIVVYPDGTAPVIGKLRTWNAGKCCGRALKIKSDDVGFLSAVIDAVVRDYGADAQHVFVTGHSNGAQMAYRLACVHPDKVAAIAPVGGASSYPCPRARPVPVLHIHGTEDHCALYLGGASCGGCFSSTYGLPTGGSDRWPCDPVEESLAGFAKTYGCRAESVPTRSDGIVTCQSWQGCREGAEVTLCALVGAGHAWQGAPAPSFCTRRPDGKMCTSWKSAVGPLLSGVDTGRMVFDFFREQARRQP